jgi:hypothetical protein
MRGHHPSWAFCGLHETVLNWQSGPPIAVPGLAYEENTDPAKSPPADAMILAFRSGGMPTICILSSSVDHSG